MHKKRFDFCRIDDRGQIVEKWKGTFAEFISLQDDHIYVTFDKAGIAAMDEVMRTQPMYHAVKWDRFKKTVIPAVLKTMKENK